VTGESGTGVSTFLLNQVAADLSKNRRIILFDPWGDLAVQLHKTYSDILVWKVGVKEPSNCSIDLFANGIRKISHDMVSERVMDLMYALFDPAKSGIIGPRFAHTMRNSIAVLRDVGEASFSNLQRLLTDTSYLTSILPRVVDPSAKAYFTKVLETTSDTSKSDVLEYILPKLNAVIPDSQLGMVFDTSITKPWSEVIKSSTKVIVVDLSALSSQSQTLAVAYSLIVQDLIHSLIGKQTDLADHFDPSRLDDDLLRVRDDDVEKIIRKIFPDQFAAAPEKQLKKSDRFEQLPDGWVKDLQSGLEYGPSSQNEMKHKEAEQFCKLAGGRLPTVQELHAIVDYEKYNPAIDKDFFPETKSSWYWTATKLAGSSGRAWCVAFYSGGVYDDYTDSSIYVRPVRASQ
jgi:hypothetical protein